jgi:hypothetical protein
MAFTTPGTAVAGDVLTAAFWNSNVRDNLDDHETRLNVLAPFSSAWTSYTPTMGGGWLLGNATTDAKYLKVGKFVAFAGQITVGSTTTKGTTMTIALPVAAASAARMNGSMQASVVVGGVIYNMLVNRQSTTIIEIASNLITGSYVRYTGVTATVPNTWATSDVIWFGGTYEAA